MARRTIGNLLGILTDASIIISFEQKPAINGKPHKAKFAKDTQDLATGILCDKFPNQRRS